MKKWGLLLILLLSLLPRTTFAEETADAICIEGETEGLDTDAVDAATEEMDAEVSFSDLLAEILSGEFDFTFANIKEKALELTFGELRMQGRLLAQLVLIVILSAILKQCSDSFQGKNVGEMGFYVCYMVLIVAILTSFYSISQSVVERMRGLCGVFGAMVPIFLVLSASSGNLTQGALMGPTLMGGATALSVGISYVLIPAIQLSIALEMTDHISEKPILGKFAELLRQCISWGMKGAAMLFMLLLSLQKIGGGALNGSGGENSENRSRGGAGGRGCDGRRGGNGSGYGRNAQKRHTGCSSSASAPALSAIAHQAACDPACVSADGGCCGIYLRGTLSRVHCGGRGIHRTSAGDCFSGRRDVFLFGVAFVRGLVGMMAAFAAYIKTITALAVFSALVGLLLPEGKYRRYTELVLGILVLTAVLRPLLGLFHAAETGDLPLTRIEQEWSDTYNGYREEG